MSCPPGPVGERPAQCEDKAAAGRRDWAHAQGADQSVGTGEAKQCVSEGKDLEAAERGASRQVQKPHDQSGGIEGKSLAFSHRAHATAQVGIEEGDVAVGGGVHQRLPPRPGLRQCIAVRHDSPALGEQDRPSDADDDHRDAEPGDVLAPKCEGSSLLSSR